VANNLIFTDMDDVLVTQRTVDFDKHSLEGLTDELCQRLLHPPALDVLSQLVEEGARIVITSTWTRFMPREGFERLFEGAGYPQIGRALHEHWQAAWVKGRSRLDTIDAWLAANHRNEAFCIIDDTDSGSGLLGSKHHRAGRVVMCRPGIGLHAGHLPAIRAALASAPEE